MAEAKGAQAAAEAAAQSAEEAAAAAEMATEAAESVLGTPAPQPSCNVVTTFHQGRYVTGCSVCRMESTDAIRANPMFGDQCLEAAAAGDREREERSAPNREEAVAQDRAE